MSTATAPAFRPARAAGNERVTFPRVLRSEWIKVTTLRSTVILLSITVVVMIGLAALYAWSTAVAADFQDQAGAMGPQGIGTDFQQMAYDAPSSGVVFGQLLIASLAVVLIASEYTTGMIRSTMVAVPTRIPALLAKTLVTAVVAFVVGVAAAFASYFVAQPLLAPENLEFGLDAPGVLASIINTGTFLALVAVMGVAIGALLRSTAGGVVTIIGLLFVLGIIVSLFSGLADWIPDAARFLPDSAGARLVSTQTGEGQLTQLQGGLVMAAWAAGLLAAAALVVKKRDV
ncbi:ABC-2 family transporter protein [Arthrobacter saudimassiliensis]|uniref:ABC-2 family transporter protein n=1 Tax=Arthrobacter saudimassiliensis TaxID=1461584 RepID=A0A078MLS7_9MICC|nr:ABC-2 family transporter protein [Arthrobacter saudimassiliensis]